MQFRSILMPNVVNIETIGGAYARHWFGANTSLNEGSAVFIGQT